MAAAEAYKALGAEVFEISLPLVEYALPIYYILSSAEASSNLARFDGVKYGYRTPNAGDDITELYTKSRSEGFGAEVQRRIMLGTYVLSFPPGTTTPTTRRRALLSARSARSSRTHSRSATSS